MTSGQSAPATKKDVQDMKGLIGHVMEELGKLYDANERWKDDIIREFHFTEENMRHRLLGANKDDMELLKDRVLRVERKVGIRP